MRAIEIINHQLHCGKREPPTPNAEQVLIKVHAAGVNRPDVMQRKGLYPPPPGASDIPGLEIAGVIETIGANVTQFKPGDAVCALVTGGGYAEYCLANPKLCLPIPEHWSFVEAASIPETYFTVWSNVFNRAKLGAKQTLFVHGGSSGIGITAIQLAKAFGAKVFVTVGNELKQQACLALGADAAINYRTQDFVAEILRLTDNNGVNVILDMIGGDYCARNLTCLAIEGTLIQIALQQAVKAEINLLPIMLKRLTLTGSTLRARDEPFKAAIAKQLAQQVWPLFNNGHLKPIIDTVFILEEAAQAHDYMESSQHIGKIILKV